MILYDENTSTFFLYNCCMRWLAVRLDLLSGTLLKINYKPNKRYSFIIDRLTSYLVCIMTVTSVMVVALHGVIPAAYAGLALAYSGQLTGILQYTVRLATETESRFVSVQRMHTYLKVISHRISFLSLLPSLT